MPLYFVKQLCDSKGGRKKIDIVKHDITSRQNTLAKVPPKPTGVCYGTSTYPDKMLKAFAAKTEKATEVSFVFRKDVPGFKNSPGRIWIRQIPRIVIEEKVFPFVRMKPGLKAIFLPYPITDIFDTTKPGPYFDCFGNPLNK